MKDHQGAWRPWAHLLYPTGNVHGNPELVCCTLQVKFMETLGLSIVPHRFRSQKPWACLL